MTDRPAGLATVTALPQRRYHAAHTEPHAFRGTRTSPTSPTSPPPCRESEPAAQAFVRSTGRLAGPSATGRRAWTIQPCAGSCRGRAPTQRPNESRPAGR